jgi:hypothetical protein
MKGKLETRAGAAGPAQKLPGVAPSTWHLRVSTPVREETPPGNENQTVRDCESTESPALACKPALEV